MDWILAAIASAIGFAGVGILDKIVIEKHSPSPRTFMIFAGALQLPGSLIPMAFVGFESYSTINILIAGGSGVLIGVSLLLMFASEGLPKRVGPKLGEIGGGSSGGTRGYAGQGYAGVTPPGLADRSEGSGQ